jgi:hypothetical protein
MNTELPTPIAAFFQAHNTGKTDHCNALFAEDAVVFDEEHEYRGDAIKAWIDAAIANTNLTRKLAAWWPRASREASPHKSAGAFWEVRCSSAISLRYAKIRLPH